VAIIGKPFEGNGCRTLHARIIASIFLKFQSLSIFLAQVSIQMINPSVEQA